MKLLQFLPALLFFLPAENVGALDHAELARFTHNQQQARELTRELITKHLDQQIRQLEENGLQELPVYSDVVELRHRLEQLATNKMRDVIATLKSGSDSEQPVSQKQLSRARELARGIAGELNAERHKLHRRLQIVKLSSQLRRMVQLQNVARNTTRSLPSQAPGQRAIKTQSAIDGQADVHALFLHLLESLDDTSRWDGAIGEGAGDAIRIINIAGLQQQLSDATTNLTKQRFPQAAQNQAVALRGMRATLFRLDQSMGIANDDRKTLLKSVVALRERQRDVYRQLKSSNPSDEVPEQIWHSQRQIHMELGELRNAFQTEFINYRIATEATAAAYRAQTESIRKAKGASVASQQQTIELLTELADRLANELTDDDLSAAQLSDLVSALKIAVERLQTATRAQKVIVKNVLTKSSQAATVQKQLAERMKSWSRNSRLPGELRVRLAAAARESVAASQQILVEPSKDSLRSAQETIAYASHVANVAFARENRRLLAVSMAEAARTGEALERIQAAQFQLAAALNAVKSGFYQDQSEREVQQLLWHNQHNLLQVLQKLDSQAMDTADDTLTETVSRLRSATDEWSHALTIDSNKELPEDVSSGNADLFRVAKDLSNVARQLRLYVNVKAKQLAEECDQHFIQTRQIRTALGEAIEDSSGQVPQLAAGLAEIRSHIVEARIQQLRAVGFRARADRLHAARELKRIRNIQGDANQTLTMLNFGESITPTKAAEAQQDVADAASLLARSVDGPLKDTLLQISANAEHAAEQLLVGDAKIADVARKQVATLLLRAIRTVANLSSVNAKTKGPRQSGDGIPDKTLQPLVTERINAASLLSQTANVRDSLAIALRLSKQAERQSGNSVAEARKTLRALANSEQIVKQQIKQLLTNSSEYLNRQSDTVADLAQQAAYITPQGAAAFREASQIAGKVAASKPDLSRLLNDNRRLHNLLQQAKNNLDQLSRQAEQDLSAASTLKHTAPGQQSYRNQLEQQADCLIRLVMADEQPSVDNPDQLRFSPKVQVPPAPKNPTIAQIEAAGKLLEAIREFAEFQRAIGKSTATVATQQQLANLTLRQSLESISRWHRHCRMRVPTADWFPGEVQGQKASVPGLGGKSQDAEDAVEGGLATSSTSEKRRQMGTRFVPLSAEFTAEVIAGQDIVSLARDIIRSNSPQPEDHANGGGSGDQQQSDSSDGGDESGESSSIDNSAQPDKSGPSTNDTSPQESDIQEQNVQPKEQKASPTNTTGQGNAVGGPEAEQESNGSNKPTSLDENNVDEKPDVKVKRFSQKPWFAQLPPAVRAAIRTRASPKPPTAYEETLRRYFENPER